MKTHDGIRAIILFVIILMVGATNAFAKNDYKSMLEKMKNDPNSIELTQYVELAKNYRKAIQNPFSQIFATLKIQTRKHLNRKLLALYALESSFTQKLNSFQAPDESYLESVTDFFDEYLKTFTESFDGVKLYKIEEELNYMNRDQNLNNEYSFLRKGMEARILVAELNRRTAIGHFNLPADEFGIYREISFKEAHDEFASSVVTPHTYWNALGKFMLNKSFANKVEINEENIQHIKSQSYYIRPLLHKILAVYSQSVTEIRELDGEATISNTFSDGVRSEYLFITVNIPGSDTDYALLPGIYQCVTDCKINVNGKFDMHPLSIIVGKYLENERRITIVEIAADTFGEVFADLSVPKDLKFEKPAAGKDGVTASYAKRLTQPYRECVKHQNNPFKKGFGSCIQYVVVYASHTYDLISATQTPVNGIAGLHGVNAGSLVIVYKEKSQISGNIFLLAYASDGGEGGDAGKGVTNGRAASDNCPDGKLGLGGNGGNGGIIALDIDSDYNKFSDHYNLWALGGKSGENGWGLSDQVIATRDGIDGMITEYIGSFIQLKNE